MICALRIVMRVFIPGILYLQATRFPSSAYKFLRELLGKNVSNPIVKQFQERFPYYKMEDDEERATINFEHHE